MYKKYIGVVICYLFICSSVFAKVQVPEIKAEGAILIEPKTNTILFEKNAHKKLYPTSTTKILTAMIVVEELGKNKIITKSQDSVNHVPSDSSHIGLAVGDKFTVKDALYGLLVGSDNFIAHDLALASKGSVKKFAERMNEKAKAYGALNTHFTNPHGYHDPNHYTTPYDLAQIARRTFLVPEITDISGTKKYTFNVINKGKIIVPNRNRLLDSQTAYYNPYVVGAKTGFHDDAQQTLVAKSVYGNMELIVVVMKAKSPDQYEDINKLFGYGQAHFKLIDNGDKTYQLVNETASDWAKDYISSAIKNKWIIEQGVNYGEGITVEGLAYMLNIALEKEERLTAGEIGRILNDSSIQGDSKITRVQVAMLLKDLVEKWKFHLEIKEINPYIPDIGNLNQEQEEAIKFMVRRGLLGAKDTIFKPSSPLSWQEAVCMVTRML